MARRSLLEQACKEMNKEMNLKNLAKYMSGLKILILAGTISLMPVSMMAQQETAPDIYRDSPPNVVQKAHPATKGRNQVAHKTEVASKRRQQSKVKHAANDQNKAACDKPCAAD